MMLTEALTSAMRDNLFGEISFAVCSLPGSDEFYYYAGDPEPWDGNGDDDLFFFNKFGNAYARPLSLRLAEPHSSHRGGRRTAASTHSGKINASTDKALYIQNLKKLITDLRINGGKAVIARTIGCLSSTIDPVEVAINYFQSFPQSFRYFFYTPAAGCWLGASPELLLSREGHALSTMALAGTRKCGTAEPWDTKNINEHNFVTDYIAGRLAAAGIDAEIHEPFDLRWGEIEHLCHPISARYSGPFLTPLHLLSPTPALAGTPLERALELIKCYEPIEREYYGGYVGVNRKGMTKAFVNLRCANFTESGYAIFSGSGITSQSVPEEEWLETEAKARPLVSAIETAKTKEPHD